MAGYLAYIQILDGTLGGRPDNTLPMPPLYPSQGPGFPTHPIAPGGQPPYPSQGPGFPTHPIAPGGQPPYPSQGPGFPGQLPMPGGGGNYPDNTLPPGGPPLFPSQGPGFPTHPIYIPIGPDGGGEGEVKPPGAENLPPIIVWIPGIGYITATPGVPPKPVPQPPTAEPKAE